MDRFLLLLLLFSPLVFGSKRKTINPLKQILHEIKRIHLNGHADDIKRQEVKPIETGFNFQNSNKNNKQDKNQKTASRKRCICGLSPDAICPDGFLETQIEWNNPLAGPMVPPHFPAEGPPYEDEDEWTWMQDRYDGDLQQNAYGWNWKDRLNDDSQAGPQPGGFPCSQQGWCCCGEKEKVNDKAPSPVKPLKVLSNTNKRKMTVSS